MPLPEIFTLGSSFKKYFEIVPAYTDALKNEVFSIRHQVFCEDLKFESERQNKLEVDDYDSHSLHLLIRSIKADKFIGCTRIILTQPDNASYPLPFEKICAATLDHSIMETIPRGSIGEVSRLAVISSYRKRKGDVKGPFSLSDEDYGTIDQPRFPYIPISLYMGTIKLAHSHGVNSLFMLTEPRLASHFKKLGANLQIIGGPVNHRGKRIPSMLNINEVINNMRFIFRPLYKTIVSDIEKNGLESFKKNND